MPQYQNLSDAFKIAISHLDKADYQISFNLFHQLNDIEKALGLLRLTTRIGKFSLAQKWAKQAILLSLEQRGPLKIAIHGAIGELLVRAGKHDCALMHMQIMNSFRAKGSSERQRHYSYLAIPLARLGEISVAESYYMRAYVLAKQNSDYLSASLSLVRRAALTRYTNDREYLDKSLELIEQLPQIDPRAAVVMKLLCFSQEKFDLSERLLQAKSIPHSIENNIEDYFMNKYSFKINTKNIELPTNKLMIDKDSLLSTVISDAIEDNQTVEFLMNVELLDMVITADSLSEDVLNYLFV